MSDSLEVLALKAECAALRATISVLTVNLLGVREGAPDGSLAAWEDGRQAAYIAKVAGPDGNHPAFRAAVDQIRAIVMNARPAGAEHA